MASKVQVPAKTQTSSPGFAYSALIVGWLIPGAGHLMTGRWVRALLLFVSIAAMFWLGIGMQGKLYVPNTGDVLEMLGFAGDLGNGIFYALGRILPNIGTTAVQTATADYGTKFIVVAGLLNFISAVDAHNLRIGRKV